MALEGFEKFEVVIAKLCLSAVGKPGCSGASVKLRELKTNVTFFLFNTQ